MTAKTWSEISTFMSHGWTFEFEFRKDLGVFGINARYLSRDKLFGVLKLDADVDWCWEMVKNAIARAVCEGSLTK